jgi:hypothetical protein
MSLAMIVGFGVVAVLAFDSLASLASLKYGLAYGRFVIGSIIIYAVTGALAGYYAGAFMALVASSTVGLGDATLGWYVAARLGPGRTPGGNTPAQTSVRIIFVILTAAAAGAVGNLIVTVFQIAWMGVTHGR